MTLNQRKREDRRINTEAHHDRISELLWAGLAGETDAVFEGATFGQGGGIVSECFEKVEEEGLGFAFFVAFGFGGELSESLERLFLRGHWGMNCRNLKRSHEGTDSAMCIVANRQQIRASLASGSSCGQGRAAGSRHYRLLKKQGYDLMSRA